MTDYGLGRIRAEDSRDADHQIRTLLPAAAPSRTFRNWYDRNWWGNQGSRPWCVEYSWHHYMTDGPLTRKGPLWEYGSVYHEAQKIDEWPGESYDGTSVRAGAKILQAKGLISEYRWAWDAQTVINALLEVGPVVVGTDWYEGMFIPDRDGIIRPTGRSQGGHAYLLNGASTKRGVVRVKNSWGRGWARLGRAYLTFDDLDRLIRDGGEACLAVEVSR